VLRPDGQQQQQQQAVGDSLPQVASNPGADFPGPFDMLGFIGQITSDLQQKHSDLTNGASEFASPNSSITLNGVDSFVPSTEPQVNVEPAALLPGDLPCYPDLDRPAGGAWSEMRVTYEEQLSMHFLGSEPPPTIFGPVGLQWKYVKPAMLALSRDFSPLLNAIYCYSDIHRSMLDGKRWKLAPMYYRFASSEIQSCILGDVAEPTLKRVFTTVFLLMLSEVFSLVTVLFRTTNRFSCSARQNYAGLAPPSSTQRTCCSRDSTAEPSPGPDWAISSFRGFLSSMSNR
jgi:hypothetical protein